MTPITIDAHPDAPHARVVMKGPETMGEDCTDLTTRIVIAMAGDARITDARIVHVDGAEDRRYPGFMSEWLPTQEEIDRLVAGFPIRMLVVGNALPPTNLWVRGDHEQ